MSEFKEGRKLKSIFWTDGECILGKNGVEEITIRMENGQMAHVAWALVKHNNREDDYYNIALAESVLFLNDESE